MGHFNSSSAILLTTLLLIVCLQLLVLVDFTNARSIGIKHRRTNGGGDLSVTINVNVNGDGSGGYMHHKVVTTTPPSSQTVGKTTKKIIKKVATVIGKAREKRWAENYLTLANELMQIEKLIPGTNDDQRLVKRELLAVIKQFTKQSEKPSAYILESSLEMVAAQKKKAQQQAKANAAAATSVDNQSSASSEGEAKTMFFQMGISVLDTAMNLADGIGGYSTTMSTVGTWIGGKCANKLDTWGMNSVANVARNTGGGIDTMAKKVAPYEQKLAVKIAPVVKSKSFQSVKRVVNVVAGVISIKDGLQHFGMMPTKLPKQFDGLKKTLTKAVAPIKGQSATLIGKITTAVNKAKPTSLINKITSTVSKASSTAGSSMIGKVTPIITKVTTPLKAHGTAMIGKISKVTAPIAQQGASWYNKFTNTKAVQAVSKVAAPIKERGASWYNRISDTIKNPPTKWIKAYKDASAANEVRKGYGDVTEGIVGKDKKPSVELNDGSGSGGFSGQSNMG